MLDLIGSLKTVTDLQQSENLAALIVFSDSKNTTAIYDGFLPNTKIKVLPLVVEEAVLTTITREKPELIILECPTLSGEIQAKICEMRDLCGCPIMVFVEAATDEDVRIAVMSGVNAFCVNGLASDRIKSLVELAFARYAYSTALLHDLERSQQELNARKIIERAKGLLMERREINERDAYDVIRRMSMAKGKPMREIAKTILEYSEFLS